MGSPKLYDVLVGTAIYTPKDDRYLADKAAVNQVYQQAAQGVWPNIAKPHPQQSGQSKDPEPPATEIPDMDEAERIWKAIVDAARGNG